MRRYLPLAAILALVPLLRVSAATDVPALISRLSNPDWRERDKALLELIDAGDEALPALRDATGSGDPETAWRARAAVNAIETGMSGEAYASFGNILSNYLDLTDDQRSDLVQRLTRGLQGRARAKPLTKLATLEKDDNRRSFLIDAALTADESFAGAEFKRLIALKRDDVLLVTVAGWYQRNGRAEESVRMLDALPGAMNLPVNLAREVARVYASQRNWARAADAYGALATRGPLPEESDVCGDRILFQYMAGDSKGAEITIANALKVDGETRDRSLAVAVAGLRREGRIREALVVVRLGLDGGAAGGLTNEAGQLSMAEGRDGEAILMFRRALVQAQDASSKEMMAEDMRRAQEAAGRTPIISREILPELLQPSKFGSAHAATALLLAEKGLVGAAASEWMRTAALLPGSPTATAQAARVGAAAGLPGAAGWADIAIAAGATGWPEEQMVGLPLPGSALRPVIRRALRVELEGNPSFHATTPEVAATVDLTHDEVIGFSPNGDVVWRWRWTVKQSTEPGRIPRKRTYGIEGLASMGDAFLVGISLRDHLEQDQEEVEEDAGQYLVVIDAKSGETRTIARCDSPVFNPYRPFVVRCGVLVTTDASIARVVAVDIASGRTRWVRVVDQARKDAKLEALEIAPRIGAWGDLVIFPSMFGNRVRAFRLDDGSTAWDTPMPGPAVDVLVQADALYVAAGSKAMRLDPGSGTIAWESELGATVLCAPSALEDIAAVRTRDGWMRGLNASDGRPQWKLLIGPAADAEWIQPAGSVFFLCRRGAMTWAVRKDGVAIRRLTLDFNSDPEAWRDTLLADDVFGRRLPFHAPHGMAIEQLTASGVLRVDPQPLLDRDAAQIVALAEKAPENAAGPLAAAALGLDPECPEALRLRARSATGEGEEVMNTRLRDWWRALDVQPPLDPSWEATEKEANAVATASIKFPLDEGDGAELWVREKRFWNALTRLRRNPADSDALDALATLDVAAAMEFIEGTGGEKPNPAAEIARLRMGDLSALSGVIRELTSGGTLKIKAAEALSGRTEPAAREALRPCLGPTYATQARIAAALTFAPEGDKDALDILERHGLISDDLDLFFKSARILLDAKRPKALEVLSRRWVGRRNGPTTLELLATSKIAEAIDTLEAMALDPDDEHRDTAMVLLFREYPKRAHEVFGKALKEGTLTIDFQYNLISRFVPGEFPELAPTIADAAIAISRQITQGGNTVPQWLNIVIQDACDVAGRGAEALEQHQKWEGLFPDSATPCNNAAWYRGIALSPEMRNGPQAIRFAIRAVTIEPDETSYWDTLAEAFRSDGKLEEAVFAATRALELAPLDMGNCDVKYCSHQLWRMLSLRATGGRHDGVARKPGAR